MNEPVVQTCSSYCDILRPYSYSLQQDMLHTSMVAVFQLIRRQLLSGMFLKRSI